MRRLVWITLLIAIPQIVAACSSQAPSEPLEMTVNGLNAPLRLLI